jgi:hypothetical protein
VTNELWQFHLPTNKWTLLTGKDGVDTQSVKNYVLPVAVGGHSMSLVDNNGDASSSLLIFFGFSEYYGSTLHVIQEYNLRKFDFSFTWNKWELCAVQ